MMRIKLRSGKQKELILTAKLGKTWKELSLAIRISQTYLSGDLKRERVLLSERTYKELCKIANKSFDKYVEERKEESWGKSKGGKNSSGTTKKIRCPEDSKELAEFYGIMLGDGNLTVKKAKKVGTYQVRIVGDSRHDKEYFSSFVKPLMERLFSIKVVESKINGKNALVLTATGKRLAEFLISKGFRAGDKIKNQLEIPLWIKNKKEYLVSCLRGVYDTDGSVYKLTNQNSYQICFTNYNATLMNDVRNGLLSLGIYPSKVTKGRDMVITKKSELRKFLNEVGFHNSRHLNKVKMWNVAS